MKTDYTCVLVGENWHLTQEQANPPSPRRGVVDGCFTSCSIWAEFTRGFDKRRPTCKSCLEACVYDETYATYGNTGAEPDPAPKRKAVVEAPQPKSSGHERPESPSEESSGT